MKPTRICRFDWDSNKAATNRRKHGIRFPDAATVFSDPLALTRYDEIHSETEERWVTIGRTLDDVIVVVVHTFEDQNPAEALIRIISARTATARERWQYEQEPYSVQEEKPMKDEYDFSKAKRGKFFDRNAILEIPVYLEPDVMAYFKGRAKRQGVSLDELLNEVLKRDMERMKAEGE